MTGLPPSPVLGRGRGTGMLRLNHAGRPVSLWEGPAVVLGLLAGTAAGGVPGSRRGAREGPEVRAGLRRTATAVVAAALVGAVDDHGPRTTVKGLVGHLGELRHGRVTTGTVKLAGLVAAGLFSPGGGRRADRWSRAGLVAGSANLVNLLDLRPGRALKVTLLVALPLLVTSAPLPTDSGHSPQAGRAPSRGDGTRGAGRRPGQPRAGSAGAAAVVTGVALAALPADLAGRSMLGDTGANALGAALGTALADRLRRPGRLLALAVVTALTLASERVSFTEVIAGTPLLDALDRWGRTARPA